MNIQDIIYNELKNRGCELQVCSGILYVITPAGDIWDMTVPQPNTKITVDELRRTSDYDPSQDGCTS